MCPADLAPDHARTILFATCDAVDVRDALAEVPLRVLRVVDTFKREEAHVGVRVAFAALVADMAGFDVYCTHCYYVHDINVAFSEDIANIVLVCVVLEIFDQLVRVR